MLLKYIKADAMHVMFVDGVVYKVTCRTQWTEVLSTKRNRTGGRGEPNHVPKEVHKKFLTTFWHNAISQTTVLFKLCQSIWETNLLDLFLHSYEIVAEPVVGHFVRSVP